MLPRLQSGGVERGTLEIAAALVQAGHRSIVVSEGGAMVTRLVAAGSEHVEMQVAKKQLGTFNTIRRLAAFIGRENPDVVHARSRLPAWLCWQALKSCRGFVPRFATSVHGLYSVNRYSAVMAKGDLIEAVSDTARDYLLENYPHVDPTRVRTIYRGVDPELYYSGFRPSAGWIQGWRESLGETDATTIVLPGRLSRLKGHFEFLDVCRELGRIGLRFQGFIVGGIDRGREKYAQSLKREIEGDRFLNERVTMLGHRNDLREIISVADVVVSLSTKPEAFGRTVLEALSLGTPVVAFGHGGAGEILRKHFPYGAVPPFDCRAVAETIIDITRTSRFITPHDYTLKKMCEQSISMYRELAL